MLTVKSDDVVGRVKVYESLVKGNTISTAGVPESFRVLIKEFQALGLNIEMIDYDDNIHDLREIEMDEEEAGEALTIDEIDVNTGEVKKREPLMPEVEEPEDPEEELEEDEFAEDEDDFDEPSDDEIMAMEEGEDE